MKVLAAMVADRIKYESLLAEFDLTSDSDDDEEGEDEQLPIRFFPKKSKKSKKVNPDIWKSYS